MSNMNTIELWLTDIANSEVTKKGYRYFVQKFLDFSNIAIELDHGHSGSRIKNALTKAGVLKLVGEFDKIAVFFFAYPPLSPENINRGKAEETVLEFFRKNLSTLLFPVRPRTSFGL